ncbi:GNAT superfamily N-acetyltransferase [Agrobacterium vitis]|nr:GNAT superfamily N-acetyltransferase [Agrobacterium vitis]MBE1440187.1 GNAT superfamily N-acetyltransferase [Agrobacterium vitis]
MAVQTSIQVESFEFSLADIHTVSVDHLHSLSVAVGWPHRVEDWQFLLTQGTGIAAIDAIGRVLGSAMWFPMGEDFSTIGMVITSPRLQTQGTGRWLMDHALENVKGRRLGLNSTRAAKRLYRSIGFTPEATVFQCQGEAKLSEPSTVLPPGTHVREMTIRDLPDMLELDKAAYGADRHAWLNQLFTLSKGFALIRENKISAYALSRPFGRGHVIGPVVAPDDEEAIAVIHPHVAAHQGRFLRIDTRQKDGAFADFIRQSGLDLFDTVTTMSLHGPWLTPDHENSGDAKIFGLASQALG